MQIKLIVGAFILAAIIGFLKWAHYSVDKAGYDRATAECQAKVIAAIKAEDEKNAKKLSDITASRDKWKAEAESKPDVAETVEVVKYVTKEIEKEVYICDDLGDSFIRVFNNNRQRIFSEGEITDDNQ